MPLFPYDVQRCEVTDTMANPEAGQTAVGHLHLLSSDQRNQDRLVLPASLQLNKTSVGIAEYLVEHHNFKFVFRLFGYFMAQVLYKTWSGVLADWDELVSASAYEVIIEKSPRREYYDIELSFEGVPTIEDEHEMFQNFTTIRDTVVLMTKQNPNMLWPQSTMSNQCHVTSASRKGKLSMHVMYNNVFPNCESQQRWMRFWDRVVEAIDPRVQKELQVEMVDKAVYRARATMRMTGSRKVKKGEFLDDDTVLTPYMYEVDPDAQEDQMKCDTVTTLTPTHYADTLITAYSSHRIIPSVMLDQLPEVGKAHSQTRSNRPVRDPMEPSMRKYGLALESAGRKISKPCKISSCKLARDYRAQLVYMVTALKYLTDHDLQGACIYGEKCSTKNCKRLDTLHEWSTMIGVCKAWWGDNVHGRQAAWATTLRTAYGRSNRAELVQGGFEKEWISRRAVPPEVAYEWKRKGYAKQTAYKKRSLKLQDSTDKYKGCVYTPEVET